ncbi:MAG TPA: PKD domain-containing protein, partial [Thermoplasmata archaeon]|nr:PKD domain-containing protein [Thermoplasmata archaeon]
IDLNIKSGADPMWPYYVQGPSYTAQFGPDGQTMLTSSGSSILLTPSGVTVSGQSRPLAIGSGTVDGTNLSNDDVVAGLDYVRVAAYEGILEFWTLESPIVGGVGVSGGLDLTYSMTLPRRAEIRVAGALTEHGTTMDASATGFEVWVDGKMIAMVPSVRVWDAAGATTQATIHISMPEDRRPGPATVRAMVSGAWLSDSARAYPVTVDPDFSGGTVSGTWDPSGNPFRILSQVFVSGTLRIMGGVRVESSDRMFMQLGSTLVADGSEEDPVEFVAVPPAPGTAAVTAIAGGIPTEVTFRYTRFSGFGQVIRLLGPGIFDQLVAQITVSLSNVTVSGNGSFADDVAAVFVSEQNPLVIVDHSEISDQSRGVEFDCFAGPPSQQILRVRRSVIDTGRYGLLASSNCFSGSGISLNGSATESNIIGQTVSSIEGPSGFWQAVEGNYITGAVSGIAPTNPRVSPNPLAGVWHRGAAPVITGPTQIATGQQATWQVSATHPKSSSLHLVVDFPPLLLPPSEFDIQSGDIVSVSRTFGAAGEFAVRAFTTDIYGVASDETVFPFSVIVPNQNPVAVARIDGNDTSTKLSFLAFEFNGTQSSDPDPGEQIVNWTWNFGDGSPLAFGPVVTHNYTDHGAAISSCRGFVATLTVRDQGGALGTDTVDACLINRPAAIPALSDVLAFTGSTVSITATGTFDPERKLDISYVWFLESAPGTPPFSTDFAGVGEEPTLFFTPT